MGIGYNFTDAVRTALQRAREEALRLRHPYVAPEHVLYGLLLDPDPTLRAIVASSGKSPAVLLELLQAELPQGQHEALGAGHLPYSITAKRVLEGAMMEAQELRSTHIGTGHLLLGLLRQPLGIGSEVLAKAGVVQAEARRVVATEGQSQGHPVGRLWFLSRASLGQVPIRWAFMGSVAVVALIHIAGGTPPHWNRTQAAVAALAAASAQISGGIYLYFRRANQVLVLLALAYILALVAWRMTAY